MLTVREAQAILKKEIIKGNDILEVGLYDSLNMVLADDIYSPINVPEFPKSAMDGYAVRSEDFSDGELKKLKVLEKVVAGDSKDIEPLKNSAIRIMTGGEIPQGYDAIVKQEDTDYGVDYVDIRKIPKKHDFYCPKGEDIKKGELLLTKGTQIKSVHLGLIASVGLDKVKIIEPIKVSVLSTGSELLLPGMELLKGHIYSSSNFIMGGQLTDEGINLLDSSVCKDDIETLSTEILKRLEKTDVLITTGGVSVGEKDLLPDVVENIGAEILFKKINIKPGTPVMASKYKDKIILSFSGNPYATLVNFRVLFWPMVSEYYKSKDLDNNIVKTEVADGYLKPSTLERYVRAKYIGGKVYIPDSHKSSVISNLTDCNCFIIQKENTELKKGEKVDIILLERI